MPGWTTVTASFTAQQRRTSIVCSESKLARTLRMSCKVVGQCSALRKSLHWLPIRARIKYKLTVVTYNARHPGGPAYLSELIRDEVKCRTLRSSGPAKLHTHHDHLWFSARRRFTAPYQPSGTVCSLNIVAVLLLGSI